MKRSVNAALVKRLRAEKGWSQDELAIAADVSTRTVQRIESEGSGSVSTVKSIASALEVDMHNLEEKPRTQLVGVRFGYAGVVVGVVSAMTGIMAGWINGDSSAYEVGVSLGLVGLIAGIASALIGWTSSHY